MFQHIKDLVKLDDSGPKAWKLLRDVIQPNTLPMVIVLEKELAALSMRPGNDVKPVLDKIKDTYARMAAAGSNVSQMQQCTKIISVLDNLFCGRISAGATRVVVLPTKLLRGMELQEAAEDVGDGEAEAVGEALAEGESEEKSSCIKDLWQLPIIPWSGKLSATVAAAATAKATAGAEETAPSDGALDAVKKVQQPQQPHGEVLAGVDVTAAWAKASSGSGEADWERWHKRLCHVNFPMLQKLVKDGSLKGLEDGGEPEVEEQQQQQQQDAPPHTQRHEQLEVAKRLVRYVSATASVGLEYSAVHQRVQRGAADLSKGEMLLTCYTDASFNSVKADGTSIGGYVCLFGGGAMSWRSKKQNEVGLSSCETEYMALHHGVKEVVWLRRSLEEIGLCQREPTGPEEESVARVVQCPHEEQVAAGMRVAKCLGQSVTVELQYSAMAQRPQKVVDSVEYGRLFLTAFSDSSYASEQEDMTSVGGFICCIGRGPTAWESKKQVDQALSSVESENMALFLAIWEIVWQRRLMAELGEEQQGPTPL
ncbi:unnamed protein product [Closterium sp. NIES-54]